MFSLLANGAAAKGTPSFINNNTCSAVLRPRRADLSTTDQPPITARSIAADRASVGHLGDRRT
jgi:hypothetical protein